MVVYVLESIKSKKRYIGYTSNWKKRLAYHNKGANRSTKPYMPYKIIYLESHVAKTDAIKRERTLKSYKGGNALKKLINRWDGGVVNRIRL